MKDVRGILSMRHPISEKVKIIIPDLYITKEGNDLVDLLFHKELDELLSFPKNITYGKYTNITIGCSIIEFTPHQSLCSNWV